MKRGRELVFAILAGIMIGIGGTALLASGDQKVVGAVIFTVGLLSICVYGMNLYTGKVGYLCNEPPRYLISLGNIWLGNLIGTGLVAAAVRYAKPEYMEKATNMCLSKLDQSPGMTLLLGIFCGLLMFIAVDNFRNNKDSFGKYLAILFCVPGFILAGFEHCIADMYYFWMMDGLSQVLPQAFGFIVMATIGNGIGGVLIPLARKVQAEKTT